MEPERLARPAGLAAVSGGLAWAVKAAVILATGEQPPLLFEVAPLFLAVGLFGLYLRTPDRPSRRLGGVMALVALAGAVVAVAAPVEDGAFSPGLLVNSIALLVGLIVLGRIVRKHDAFGGRLRSSLPLVMGIATFPALMIGGALSSIDERLLEVPLVLIGVAWVALGVLIATPAPSSPPNVDGAGRVGGGARGAGRA